MDRWRDAVVAGSLYLNNSQLTLTSFLASTGQLAGLRWLNLNDNQRTSLPAEIGQLAGLRWLLLGGRGPIQPLPTRLSPGFALFLTLLVPQGCLYQIKVVGVER